MNFVEVDLVTTRLDFKNLRLRNSKKRFDQLASHIQIFDSKPAYEGQVFHSVRIEDFKVLKSIGGL